MLSETRGNGHSLTLVELKRALYARTRSGRTLGIVLGFVLHGAVGGGMLIVGPQPGLAVLLVVPVGVLSWYGGRWLGVLGAILGAGVQLGSALMEGAGAAQAGGNAGVTLVVLLLASRVMPGLRFAAQSYREHAQIDPLTNLGNRRFFRELAAVELNRSKRYRRPVSLVYLEADGLERVQQRSGHAESDALLMQLAAVMTASLRSSDVVARISGGEFAILLPETTGMGAQVVADKLRERLTEAATTLGHHLEFRAAIVGFGEGSVSLEAMLRQADEAMMDSRRTGAAATSYRDYEHPAAHFV